MHIIPTSILLNKIMESIEDFCDMCIKDKNIRIIKHKVMIPKLRKLEKIHTDL